ncbi:MAG TPA: SGNH/GDSL hydrolase family protein [Dongiaceae bacterium]|nr:SGNH/GDSL hydrolase family protein [Dongiaceae bacterium]
MASKYLFLIGIALVCVTAQAQTKTVVLSGGATGATLGSYSPDPLVRPTGTAVIICGAEQSGPLEKAVLADLSRTGCVGFVLRPQQAALTPADVTQALAYVRTNATEYQIRQDKIGWLVLDEGSPLTAAAPAFAFVGLIDPVTLPKWKAGTPPVLIEASPDQAAAVLRYYTKATKSGAHIDLRLHEQAMSDAAKSTEWIDWLGSLGYLKPLSEEKTEALKNKEAWDNLAKFYDDRLHKDWAWLGRYESDNAKLAAPAAGEQRVIFLGDSITEGWINTDPDFFKTNEYINRGIGGQTTPQMLVRFREDVVNLQPKVVIILAGINDIAENTGPSKIENVAGNIFSMCELAQVHGCRPILCSVLPAAAFPWHPGIDPVPSVLKLNALLRDYASSHHLAYVDYYSAVVAENQGMKQDLAKDGVHPNLAGYKIMEPLAEAAIAKALTE